MEYPVKLIAAVGKCRVGKDLLGKLISERMDCSLFSFAKLLKDEVRECVLSLSGIDVWNCSPEQKEDLRPLLVWMGCLKREQTNGTYWIDALDRQIHEKLDKIKGKTVFITDCRFPNEGEWIKNNGGVLVYVDKYTIDIVDGKPVERFAPYPNAEEEKNTPLVRAMCDYEILWPDMAALNKDESILFGFVNDFLHKYNEGTFNK